MLTSLHLFPKHLSSPFTSLHYHCSPLEALQFHHCETTSRKLTMTHGDHHLTFRTSISIAQIPVFSLSLLIAYYFRRTHRMGWFCIGIFSIIRLVSASCLLALINEDKHSLKATVFVCENLGIMLFVFIFVEVLEWVCVFIFLSFQPSIFYPSPSSFYIHYSFLFSRSFLTRFLI